MSIWLALSMLHPAAHGDTRKALEQVLGIEDPDSLLEAVSRLLDRVKPANESNGLFQLHLANALFLHKKFPLNPDYRQTLRTTFKADLANVDTSDPVATADRINDWWRSRPMT